MDKNERTALARRIGRMNEEQVNALLPEARQKRNEATQQHVSSCPDCKYVLEWREYDHCDEYNALPLLTSIIVGPGEKPPVDLRRQHIRNGCPNCKVRAEGWEKSELCPRCQAVSDQYDEGRTLLELCHRRLNTISYNKKVKAFEQEHGRKPASYTELYAWADQRTS